MNHGVNPYFILLLVSLLMAFQVWIHHLDLQNAMQIAATGDFAIGKALEMVTNNGNEARWEKKK